jgi:uncharacterized protein (TIGR02391 family)
MPRKPPQREPQSANVSPEQMKAALPKLKRRIDELQAVDVNTIRERGEPRFDALEQKIDSTLVDVFGHDTVEHRRYRVMLDTASINMSHPTPLHEVREGYKRGIEQAVSNLSTIVELFEEKLGEMRESPDGRARRAFGELDIHPEVQRAVSRLFAGGHYSNAIEDACKVLDGLVKLRSGKHDLSGTELMQFVFSPKNPILRFSKLETESERSEQQGMMFLYSGAMLALRNPRAHELIEDDPEKALEYIAFISLLAKSLDKAERA